MSRRGAAASLAISLVWHGLILAVLALAVHPFALPKEPPPVDVELLPPLLQQPAPTPPVKTLQPKPKPNPSDPLEILRRPEPVLSKPQVVQQKTVAQPKLVTDIKAPEPLPPAPTETAKPSAPVLSQPLQLDRRNPAPPKLQAQRPSVPDITPAPAEAAPQAKAEPKAETAPAASAPLQVLTNEQVVRAPIEIKPPAKTAIGPRSTALPTDQLPPPGGGGAGAELPGGGLAGGGGAAAGVNAPMDKPVIGYDAKGVRTGPHMLGCYTPEAYLSPAEKAACAQQMAEKGKKGLNLGLNMDPGKLAEFDRNRACHANTVNASQGRANQTSADTTVTGMGANPRLRDCGPGDR